LTVLECALATVRGQLNAVLTGDHDPNELRRILDATAASKLAKICDVPERQFILDWNVYLSDAEQAAISGVPNIPRGRA
jgi:hypothetical protein